MILLLGVLLWLDEYNTQTPGVQNDRDRASYLKAYQYFTKKCHV
ncbi:MAG: hypothetical protein ACRC62_28415 [Microcoleus sp.]